MCLTKVFAAKDAPSDLIVDGWKEFMGTLAAPTFCNFGGVVPLDKWIIASEIKTWTRDINASDGRIYKPGFHIYSDETQVKKRFRRVYYRRVTCAGEQDGLKCVIAQEMYVPSNPNDWPPKPIPPKPVPPKITPKKSLMGRIRKRAS